MDRREKIFESALSIFAENGFRGTSLSQIARNAGTQKQLITHHFGSKDNLWREVVNRELVDGVQLLKNVLITAKDHGPEAGIRQFIHEYIHWCFRKKDFHRLIVFDKYSPNDRFKWYAENHSIPSQEAIVKLIRQAQKTGAICKGNPARIYFTFLNMVNSLVLDSATFELYLGRAPNNGNDIEKLKMMIFRVLEMENR